ncbi:MAG: hypothetical protein HOM25_18015 [Rhodospirillaceae bacterium]|jgi:hemerythrin-like domain-containing protein|nr:hypothetical protein [Rhodospirillaceae bacterium]MBT5664275.1 hypothetical protein [Rhodospirillaceae bacterium]
MPAVLDALYRDHANMVALLRVLDRQLTAFDDAEPVDYEIVGDVLTYCRDYPDIRHHPIEDHLYIVLRNLNPEMAAGAAPIVAEHGALADLAVEASVMLNQVLMEMSVSRDEFSTLGRRFVEAQTRHMEAEEKLLFPVALRVLKESHWDDMATVVLDPGDDPVFADGAVTRFDRLREVVRELSGG